MFLIPARAVNLSQRGDLNGIAKGRTRTMRLNVVEVEGINIRCGQSIAHNGLLGQAIGGGHATASPVLVYGRAWDQRQDSIAIGLSAGEWLEDQYPATLSACVTIGHIAERLAMAGGRQGSHLGEINIEMRREQGIHPRYQSGFRFASQQTLARQMES